MKKVVLLLTFLSFAYFASAQGISVGAKFGPGLTNVWGADVKNNNVKASFFAGFLGDFAFSDMLSAQIEMNFEGKGFTYKFLSIKEKHSYTYLTIPILFKAKFDVGPVKIFANTGPYFGFLLGYKVNGDKEYDEGEKYKEFMNTFDIGLSYGGGAMYEFIDGFSVFAELRHSMGFTNVYASNDNYIDDNGYKNTIFQIGFGMIYTVDFK